MYAHAEYTYGMAAWWQYEGGIHQSVDELEVKQGISEVVEAAKVEGVKPTASVISSVLELSRIKTFVPAERWDADPDILVCQNGALYIPTGELRNHSKEYYATSAVPYAYDPDAKAPVWEMYLKGTIPEAADFLQEFAGYSVTADTSLETAVWLSGPRGSGKSTGLMGLQTMLGARAGILGLADIERNRFALANLPGKTLVLATEQPASFIRSTDVLNAIISGEPIQVERKYKDAYEITPHAKVAWAMNDLPRVSETTNGIFRRVKVIEFPTIPEEDRDPEIKNLIANEGAGILNWALEGLARLRRRGHFKVPESVRIATREFQESNDVVGLFVEEKCIRDPEGREQPSELYKEYKFWCEEHGHKPVGFANISKEWERLGFESKRSHGKRYWAGVRMRLPHE
jgi:putative DNA primase/helicase